MNETMNKLIENGKNNMNKVYDALNECEKYDLMYIMEDVLKPMYERAIEVYIQGDQDTKFIELIGGSHGVDNIIELIISTNVVLQVKNSINANNIINKYGKVNKKKNQN